MFFEQLSLSLPDYILIFGAVSFIIVVLAKVMSVTMTFVRLTLKRIKSGPSRNKEVQGDEYAGDFERKNRHQELVSDSDIRNFVTNTSVRYEYLSEYRMDQSNATSEFNRVFKMKLPKNKKATDDMFNYVLWNYAVKNKDILNDLLTDYRLSLQQPKNLLTEYDIPNYHDEGFIEEQNGVVTLNNYRRVERELCSNLINEIRENEGHSGFEIVVKLAYVDVLGLRQIEDKSYTYDYVNELLETIPFAQDLVLELSHRYQDIMAINQHYVTKNIQVKQVYNNYKRDVMKSRPYRDPTIVNGITMPFRKFREIEQKLCRDILLKPS